MLKKDKNINKTLTTKLFPLQADDFKNFEDQNNFKVEIFGSLSRDTYIEKKSKNIVILIQRFS